MLGSTAPVIDQQRKRGVRLVAEDLLSQSGAPGAEVPLDAPDEDQRGRLTEGAGQRQHHSRKDARSRVRQDVAPDHLPSRGADPVGGLTDAGGHRAECLGRRDDHDRQHEHGQREPTGYEASRGPDPGGDMAQRVHEDGEAQQPVNDGGHTGQVPDVRVDEPCHARVPSVLLDVDGGADADGQGHDGDDRHQQEGADQRLGDARVRGDGRVPVGEEAHAAVHERRHARDRRAPQHQDQDDHRYDERQDQDGLEQAPEEIPPVPPDRPLDLGDGSRARHSAGHQ